MYFKCCIPNCASKREDTKLHKFPSHEDQRKKWLDSIKRSLIEWSVDTGNMNNLLVCHKHFEKRFHTAKSGLKKIAYPTLFSVKEIEDGISSKACDDKENNPSDHSYARKRHYDHTYYASPTVQSTVLKHNMPLSDLCHMPSTSTSVSALPHAGQLEQATDLRHFMPSTSTSASALSHARQLEQAPGELTSSSKPTKVRRKRVVKNYGELTPKCKLLYNEYKKSRRQLNFNVRAKKAIAFSNDHNFEMMTRKMNPLAKKLFNMQIKLCTKSKKGRRFSLDEKLIALSILKQSPKAYRFLQKIFILPSTTTLKKMISGLDIKAGINSKIFEVIKDEVSGWNDKKKLCNIMFDEMALEPSLEYSQKNDCIHGFVEVNEKTNDLADHALVFLVRGSVFKWQQPVAFYFTQGAVSSLKLQIILKDVVSAVVETGLVPIALVSDQGSSFQSALRSLQETTRGEQIRACIQTDDTIQISGASMSVIFDPPHLIKGMRNNFLSKEIISDGKISKWQDIVDVYQTDCKHTQSRLLHKLNDEHIIPGKVKKMKVKNCVRVFSKTMAAALSYTAEFSNYTDGRPVSDTLKNTSEMVSFLDDVFDSVNGSTLDHKKSKGKLLRKAVTNNSVHHKFWMEAKKKFEKIKFLVNGNEKSVPTLKNWVTTINSYQRIWQVLYKKNITVMRPRYFNSDPIENFFGRVRAYNFRNNDPTCHTFISTFKSLLITGFIKFHSESYNCEDDTCTQLIKVQSLFTKTLEDNNVTSNIDQDIGCVKDISDENIQVQAAKERLNVHSRAYTAGWVIKKVLARINCKQCEANLCTNMDTDVHRWISHREYKTIKQKKLTYPSEYAVRHFGYVIEEVNEYLEYRAHQENVTEEIKKHITSKYPFDFINCENHKAIVLDFFLRISIKLSIYNWCNIINKILKGTDLIRLEKRESLPPMQKKALTKYKKKLKNKSFNK